MVTNEIWYKGEDLGLVTFHKYNNKLDGISPPIKTQPTQHQMLDPRQKWQVQRMHRNYGGNRKHQKRTLRHGPSIILKIIWKIVWVSQPFSHDPPPEGKIRTQSRPIAQSRARGPQLSAIQIHHFQQSCLLLSQDRQNTHCTHLPHSSFRTLAQNWSTKNFGRYSSQSMCCTQSTR